jgi:hypothetical protein
MKPSLMRICSVISFMIILFAVIVPPCFSDAIVATDKALVKYDTGVVYDPEEGLEWYAGPDRGLNWQTARNWVAALDAAGGGWRMPTRRELKTLFRISDGFNDITPLLNNSGYWIWAGQTEAAASKWVFSFSYGGEGWNGPAPADGARALAVRVRTR